MLHQIDMIGEVLPTLRKEFEARRPAGVPDAPTHASRGAERAARAAADVQA